MGYKLAGFRLIGCVEIDPKMLEIYKQNLNPVHSWNMPIQEFNKIPNDKLPKELFNLDVLDGSPPCSVFSMSGAREKKWGSEHAFREGQATQRLDDLFIHFINTAKMLKPKFVIAENVKGMLFGNAKGYVKEIFDTFESVGYSCQLFLLNSSRMGVAQRRERVFFIAKRKDIEAESIKMNFNMEPINVIDAISGVSNEPGKSVGPAVSAAWKRVGPGEALSRGHKKGSFFSWHKINPKKPCSTITATNCLLRWDIPTHLNGKQIARIQSFPDDYDFMNTDECYVCGMSVPPYMMKAIATEVKNQWIGEIK